MTDDTDDDPPVEVAHQARFTDEGTVSTEGEVTETALTDYGADVDDRDRERRLDRPQASEFGVDDRPEVERTGDDGEQVPLFVDVEPDQRTLTGEQASTRCRFETSSDGD